MYVYVYTYVCVHIYIYIHIHIYIHVFLYIYLCIYTQMHAHTRACAHTHTPTLTNAYIYTTHTYIHIHTYIVCFLRASAPATRSYSPCAQPALEVSEDLAIGQLYDSIHGSPLHLAVFVISRIRPSGSRIASAFFCLAVCLVQGPSG